MPILGVIASSTQQGLSTNSYESIQTITTAGTTITFSGIPNTYKHLQLRFSGKSSNATYQNIYWNMQFNTDTGNNYNCHSIYGDGSSASVFYNGTYTNSMIVGNIVASGGGVASQNSSPGIIDIYNYKDTYNYKTVKYQGGYEANGNGIIRFGSGLWLNTAAITSISLIGADTNVVAALYGIKE